MLKQLWKWWCDSEELAEQTAYRVGRDLSVYLVTPPIWLARVASLSEPGALRWFHIHWQLVSPTRSRVRTAAMKSGRRVLISGLELTSSKPPAIEQWFNQDAEASPQE
jgi:hypothetical protein